MQRLSIIAVWVSSLLVGTIALQAKEKELLLCVVENGAEAVTIADAQECNPFSEQKCLVIRVAETTDLAVQVVTPMGKVVKRIAVGRFEAGEHCLYWDGRDSSGEIVKGGVYVYAIESVRATNRDLAFLP